LDIDDALEEVRKERAMHTFDGLQHHVVPTGRAAKRAPLDPTLKAPHADDEIIRFNMLQALDAHDDLNHPAAFQLDKVGLKYDPMFL
jgi:hypothetical protein